MKPAYVLLAVAACVAVSGCGIRRALGMDRNLPDEFAVVGKAPLVVPPEYSLLPPRPGEPRPQELDAAALARQALIGAAPSTSQSPGEQQLAALAGSGDPAIRATIERETAGVSYKTESFANRILFWQDGDTYVEGDPLDPEAEAERLRRADSINDVTGGAEVEIERQRSSAIKLPGL